MSALDYFIKANLCLILFYGCYWLGLRKHTFFGLNRAYLLASLGLSLGLPLIQLPAQTVAVMAPLNIISLPPVTTMTSPIEAGPDWVGIGWELYGLVAAGLTIRLITRIWRICQLIRRSRRQRRVGYTLVFPDDPKTLTFSFFRWIILAVHDADPPSEIIYQHELAHVRQWHSADVLLLEVAQIVCWINPILILYQRSMQQLHEFLADRQTMDARILSKREYASFLVDYAFGIGASPLMNHFYTPSLLKQRIQMLHRKATSRWAFGKYLLVLPLALGLLAMTTAKKQLTEFMAIPSAALTVQGYVFGENSTPLAGANIVIKGSTMGTKTDEKGAFQFRDVPDQATLVISFVGYQTYELAVDGHSVIDFKLSIDRQPLNGIVVTGNGPTTRPQTNPQPVPVPPSTSGSGETFTIVEQNPEFPGGLTALNQYVNDAIRYPDEARQKGIEGTVSLYFTVETDVSIAQLQVAKSLGYGCDEEAVRIISQMPRWHPGVQNGKPVAVAYELPIEFQLKTK